MQNNFPVIIENRDGIVFSGQVAYLSSHNETGKFDILPEHANFITLIKGDIELHLENGRVQQVPADNAVLKFEDGQCEVYMGIKQADIASRKTLPQEQ